jgi:hypothetical protein
VAEVDLASGAVTVRPVLATAANDENGLARSATWLPSGLLGDRRAAADRAAAHPSGQLGAASGSG